MTEPRRPDIIIRQTGSSDLICPFCEEKDFDLIGLKSHISHGDCETYNITLDRERIF